MTPVKPSGCCVNLPSMPSKLLVKARSWPVTSSMKCSVTPCGDPIAVSPMVPDASPRPSPQNAGVEMVAETGGAGRAGVSPAHCGGSGGGGPMGSKSAVAAACDLEIVPLPCPAQPPLHPENIDPAAGWAVNVTGEPTTVAISHVPGQSMPFGVEVTRPAPVPVRLTERRSSPGGNWFWPAKVAVTERFALMSSVQVVVPEQSPCQPMNGPELSALALSTTVPPATLFSQSAVQVNDGLALCTEPPPATWMVNECEAGAPPPPLWLPPHAATSIPAMASQPLARMPPPRPPTTPKAVFGCPARQRGSARNLP